jgi:hypothetical protein
VIPAELQRLAKALPQLEGRAGETYRLPGGRVALQTGRVLKSAGVGRMCVQSLLSTDDVDYDGDRINPAGGDWRPFAANPLVNWEHDVPIGTGTVPVLKAFKVGTETHMLPVGETTFFKSAADCRGLSLRRRDRAGRVVGHYSPDECAHAADSVMQLIERDIASGVSIEFRPAGPEGKAFWQRTGHDSVLLGRPEMHWERWLGEGWAHALHAKNPNAATILGTVRFDKAFRIAETGKFPGGAKVSPLILKAFDAFKGRKPQYARVERKAMPDMDMIDDAPPGVDTPDDVPADGKPAGMKATPQLILTVIQGVTDLIDHAEGELDGPNVEHEKGSAALRDALEDLRDSAAALNAKAAKIFPDAGFESATRPPEPDAEAEPEVETTDDGAVKNKAFPGGFPVRFRVAKNGTGFERVPAPAADDPDAATLKAICDETESILAEVRRERRKLEKNNRIKAANDRRARGY